LYLLTPFTYFTYSPPTASGNHQFVLCNYKLACFVLDSRYEEIILYLPFSVWLISFNIMPSGFIHVITNSKVSLFFMAEYTHTHTHTQYSHKHVHTHMHASHLYPFIHQWTFRSLPYLVLCAKLFQSCPAFWHPMDYSPARSSVHGILQARILEWVAMTSSISWLL